MSIAILIPESVPAEARREQLRRLRLKRHNLQVCLSAAMRDGIFCQVRELKRDLQRTELRLEAWRAVQSEVA